MSDFRTSSTGRTTAGQHQLQRRAEAVYYEDLKPILAPFASRLGIVNYQLRITHEQRRDRLSVVIAVSDPAAIPEPASREVLAELHAQRPMLRDCERTEKIHATRIDWVSATGVAINPRTGKLRRVLDERKDDAPPQP
ncbi:MAG: hypothetical protein E6J90_02065 [Deltaproteobacteria bacterium]|nr:MAG: hypothetical protein E6J91_08020 [Deltaproteobacteria bacterium]TMQ27644.1 MAG: hypothetical protein E6J90_02065 [Deltaproteobacteria bacterium]